MDGDREIHLNVLSVEEIGPAGPSDDRGGDDDGSGGEGNP